MILTKKSLQKLCIHAYFPISLRPSEDSSCTQLSFHFNIIKPGRKLCLQCLCWRECVVNWPVMWLLSEVDCLCNISPVNMSHQTLSLSPSVIWIQCGYFKTRYTPLNVNSSLLVPLQNLIWITYVSSWQGQKESCSSTLTNAYIIGEVTSSILKLLIIFHVIWSCQHCLLTLNYLMWACTKGILASIRCYIIV